MKIITKVIFGFGAVLTLTMLGGVIGWNGLDRFAQGVDAQQEMAVLVNNIDTVDKAVLTFRSRGDIALLSKAEDGLTRLATDSTRLQETSDREERRTAMTAVTEAIQAYAAGLGTFKTLETENRRRLSEMKARTDKLENLAVTIQAAQAKAYGEVAETLAVVENSKPSVWLWPPNRTT